MTLIKERLDTVTIFTRPDNEIGLEKICKFLRGVKNVRGLTAKLKRGAAGGTTKGGGIARSIWDGIMKVPQSENLLTVQR
jgi:DNA mismatch repair protein MSH5